MRYCIVTQLACVAVLMAVNMALHSALPWWAILSPIWLPLAVFGSGMACALLLLFVVIVIAAAIGGDEE